MWGFFPFLHYYMLLATLTGRATMFPISYLSYIPPSLYAEFKTEWHAPIFKIWPITLEIANLELYCPSAPYSHLFRTPRRH